MLLEELDMGTDQPQRKCCLCMVVTGNTNRMFFHLRQMSHFACRPPGHKKTDADKFTHFKVQLFLSLPVSPSQELKGNGQVLGVTKVCLPLKLTSHQRAISIRHTYIEAPQSYSEVACNRNCQPRTSSKLWGALDPTNKSS